MQKIEPKAILQQAFTWDAHSCVALNPQANLRTLEKHLQQGFNYVSINIGMDMNTLPQIMRVIAAFRYQIQQSDFMVLADTVAAIHAAQAAGKLAISFDLEGGIPLLESPEMVFLFHQLGVRQIHLAYNRNNSLAGGCYDEDMDLTPTGRAIVEAINQAGILMDCSHTGHRSSLSIMECSSAPVIFSHANVRALNPNLRNLTNEQIDTCAAQGGVIGVNGVDKFLGDSSDMAQAMVAQMDYLLQRVGNMHVGIGLDYVYERHLPELDEDVDPGYWWPKQFGYGEGLGKTVYAPPESLHDIVAGLDKLGYGETTIRRVLGENFLRVAQQVWHP